MVLFFRLFLCRCDDERDEMVYVAVVPEVYDETVGFVFPAFEFAVYCFVCFVFVKVAVGVGCDGESVVFCR